MIIMRHDVGIQWADRSEEQRHIDLVVYGDSKGYSAMAATVGFPTGIAARMVLEGLSPWFYPLILCIHLWIFMVLSCIPSGEIQEHGMLLPFGQSIYRPMLKRLQQEGIMAKEYSEYKSVEEVLS